MMRSVTGGKKMRWLSVWLVMLWAVAAAGQHAVAQSVTGSETAVITDQSANVAEFRRLLADPEVQVWLRGAAENDNTLADSAPLVREQIGQMVRDIRTRIDDLRAAASSASSAPGIIANSWRAQLSAADSLRVAIYIVIFLFVGAGFEWLYAQYTHYRLLELQLRTPDTLRQRLTTALFRVLILLGSLFAFAVGSIGTFLLFRWPEVVDDIVMDILIIVLVVRIATTLSRFFLSPGFKALRLVPFTGLQSRSLHRWLGILVAFGVVNFAVSDVFGQIVSMSVDTVPRSAALSVDVVLNFAWLAVVLLAIWWIRRLFVSTEVEEQSMSATIWPIYLKVLAMGIFVLWLIDTPKLMWSFIILGFLFPMIVLCRSWVDNLYDQAEKIDKLHGVSTTGIDELPKETDDDYVGDDIHAHNVKKYEIYRPIVRRLVRFILVISAVLALIVAWNINLFALSSSLSLEGRILEITIDIVIAVLIADLIWVWAKSAIDRRLAAYEPPQDGQTPGPEARMATLLPLLRTILLVALLIMVLLSVMSAFGINIAPLLAGAGVLGVAVGFGAQALVRDVVSGIFFLVDDAFRVGEYIEIDGLRGTVETMSIRSLRIRHHRGAVHTIPFGELKALTNYSRDWVIMKLEFRVPFDTDLKLVKKLVKTIGAELQQNPDYGDSIIQPLKSQGVRRMEEFNMVVGVKFMAKPGEQWLIRRDAFQKVRDAFDANGILFAERNVKVEVLNAGKLDKATEEAALGAAQDAIEQALPAGPIPDEP